MDLIITFCWMGGATKEIISDLYHNCGVEGFVLGKQELFFPGGGLCGLHRQDPGLLKQ
mgnify:CR=1 FL=1